MKLNGTFHKAVVKKILPLTDPSMYMCVYSLTSKYSGQVQSVVEIDLIPACDTYKFFNRSWQELTHLAQELSQSSHGVRSVTSKRGGQTKKVLKTQCGEEVQCILFRWKAYCHGDDGTQTWSVWDQDKPITASVHVPDPFGR